MRKVLPFTAVAIVAVLLSFTFFNAPAFVDLNKNGKMDVYEDKTQSVDSRVNDLLSQMTIV